MTSDSPSARSANTGTQYHWSFIRIGLWVSLSLLVILFLVGIWSYKQTNELVRQAQEQTASGLAAGLANAVEENMIVRDFGQVEVQHYPLAPYFINAVLNALYYLHEAIYCPVLF